MTTQFDNQIEIDRYNKRIVGYIPYCSEDILTYLSEQQQLHGTTKTIVYTPEIGRILFERGGYQEEGKIDKFFLGEDAYIMSRFPGEDRGNSTEIERKDAIIRTVMLDQKKAGDVQLDSSIQLEYAGVQDVDQLAGLYRKVFEFYPSEVYDPQYLLEHMGENYVFVVAKHEGSIISAASAVIKPEFGCAEITDCVTNPEFRGNNLTAILISRLEEHLRNKQIYCLYSLTRADSMGMNITVHRLGYTYQGRLVNNCWIYSGPEDMNVWTKYIG